MIGCLRLKKRDKIFARGYEKLEKEIHVTYLIKQMRVMKGILKESMTKAAWNMACTKYSLKSIDKAITKKESLRADDFLQLEHLEMR